MLLARTILAITVGLSVAGCAADGQNRSVSGIYDPHEGTNRKVHAFNRKVDERLFRGGGSGLTNAIPEGAQITITRFAQTTSLPQTVVNQILQGQLGDATRNSLRFAVNATLGFGGLADVATDLGMPHDESDFGETLHVWGAGEGAYVELPLLGPSTERDALGKFVDLFTDPLSYVVPAPDRYVVTGAKILDTAADRGRFSDTVEGVLYESADSYAQLRLIYLQKRRFELGQDTSDPSVDVLALDTEGF